MQYLDSYGTKDSLLESLVLFTKLYHKAYSPQALMAGLPIDKSFDDDNLLFSKKQGKSLFSRAASRAGLKTTLVKKTNKRDFTVTTSYDFGFISKQ